MRYTAYILILISINTMAQTNGDWIESGQLKLRVNADGQMATFNNSAASELVSGSNNHLFKFINLWISAIDDSGKLRVTTVNGFNGKSDYSPGPTDSLAFRGAEPAAWDYVWSVSADEIKEHRKNFQNANYVISESIKKWPANGTDKFYKYLAPFIDYDEDGKYMPEKGDYPDIIGDKASYFIVNDNYSEHKASHGQALKIEIYGMAYSLNGLPNTVFTKYFIINRTDRNFTDLKISFHSGFQLGNDNDNYCGTLVPQNMIFAFNGDANDENHFGTGMPLASMIVLNKGLSSTLYVMEDSSSISGMPYSPVQHRTMMEGKWKSSKPLTFGGNGTGNTVNASFVYPGQTDPAFIGQNWEENSTPGKRSMLANMSFPSLGSKKGFIELDIAVSGFDKSDGNPYSFLDKKGTEIKNAWLRKVNSFNKVVNTEYTLQNPITGGENFYKEWFNNFEKIQIYNAQGQNIIDIKTKVDNRLILNQKGIYYISLISENQIITKKILIL